ncbi:MAG: helicase-exonuclease AddAB subunit AddA [Bacteroidales bacterium]|nr:helicase-exonuclease AddAB subunit AddA [Clostridium sp.]MCM1204535.1 helicase-exonuclease AddAB subunit AddA [Bacteroidales bacterium]
MNWTPDQQKIIDAGNGNLLVSAAAGSGKTAVLVERIIRMISDRENPLDIDELLVVTFTKAAAAQMRDKIAEAIEEKLIREPENEHYLKQMNYIHQANIMTIDSFCYQVVKEHFHVLGIDPGIRIGEAGEIGLLREEVLGQVIEEFYEKNLHFSDFSDAFSADKEDSRVEEYMLKIYDISASYPRPEEWIRQAKANLHIETEADFAALPFVRQYRKEIRNTAEGIRDKILEALGQARAADGPLYMEKALLSDITLVEDILSAKTYSQFRDLQQIKFVNIGRGKKGEFDEEIADWIKRARDAYKKQIQSLLSAFTLPFSVVLDQFQKQEPMLAAILEITGVFRERFLQAKLEKGLLEFSDVEHFALEVLCEKYDGEGEPVPSVIGREMSEGFKEILIDEYQDSNYLQEAILKCVSTVSQGKNNMFMVGDVKQSIYRFRMARPDLFMEKYHSYTAGEGSACRKLLLKNNFRSRANVLNTINYIFYQIMGADLGGIEYQEEEALVPGKKFPETPDDSVELLLGESRDFDFLNAGDEEMSSGKEENLDENLEDIGKMELEAAMVAKRIEKLLGRDGSRPLQITDEHAGADDAPRLRDVCLKDIVILFRAPASFQQVFSEVLMSHDIPVKVQNDSGYFDTVEIRMVLSLLKVIDNPHNDVETAAVLRGYFGKLDSEELSVLALLKRYMEKQKKKKEYIYPVVKQLAEKQDASDMAECLPEGKAWVLERLCSKCRGMITLIEGLREKKSYVTIGQLLADIYYDTGYYYYVEAMPEGKQRIRNLDLFLGETNRFENGAFQTLFDFLMFVDKLQEKAISLGGDPAQENTEDVVRLMSIHKSKGLEFPVVFLSGTGKRFNLMDTKTPLIIHSDYYLGAKYIDTKKRCGNDTFTRKAFAALTVTESIAEELRILYVGLTRAKEKLIMTGVTADVPALVRKYEAAAGRENVKISYSIVHTAGNYLDLITASFIRNKVFHETMKKVRKRMDKKGEGIISAEYHLPAALENIDIHFHMEVYDFKSLAVRHLQSALDRQVDKSRRLDELKTKPAMRKEEIEEKLAWKYADELLTGQKSKLSVTEIKRIYETDYEPSDVVSPSPESREDHRIPVPLFIAKERSMDAAEKGTWVHKIMEMLDNAGIENLEQAEKALADMRREKRIPEETASFITADKLFAFVDSPLGRRMRLAARRGELLKEKQFVIGVPVERLTGKASRRKNDTPVVVQGIIDAYFKEGDGLILLDYKTDNIKPGQEELLAERYKTQLRYYRDTLKQLTGLTVSETYLYSFALDKEIRIF